MPKSRFLKKKHGRPIDVTSAFVPTKLNVENNFKSSSHSDTGTHVLEVVGKEKSKSDANKNLSRLKDEEFVSSINKRLNILTKSLSPPSSSFTFGGSTSRGLQSKDLSNETHFRAVSLPNEPIEVRKVHLERPAVLEDRWKTGAGCSGDRAVRNFLLERKYAFESEPYEEEDRSDLIHSLWQIVRTTDGINFPTTHHWLPLRSTGRREMDEFSDEIGRIFPSSGSGYHYNDGTDFWTRLAICKGEFMRLEQLINHRFDRNRALGELTLFYPRRYTEWPSFQPSVTDPPPHEIRSFAPAELGIRWALQRRLNLLL